jgi:predicted porin
VSALAALAATGAFAQSTVTIYGTLDASGGSVKRTLSETGSTSSTQKVSTLGGLNNSRATNVIGFRGVEDLGGGMRAGFTYEFGLNGNNVANNGNLAAVNAGNGSPFGQTRQAFVSLASDTLGTVALGSQNTIAVALRGMSPAFQDTSIGGSFISQLNGTAVTRNPIQLAAAGATFAAQNSAYLTPNTGVTSTQPRYSNVLSYTAPVMRGLKASLMMVQENSETGASQDLGIPAAKSKTNGQIFSLEYDNGPLMAKFAYTDKAQKTVSAALRGSDNEVSSYAIAASYNLGIIIPFFVYEAGSNKFEKEDGVASSAKIKTKGYELGARIPFGSFTPFVSLGDGTWKATEDRVNTVKAKGKMYQVGTTYSMSKRTTLYAAIGSSKWTGSVENVEGSGADKQQGYRLGLTHSF